MAKSVASFRREVDVWLQEAISERAQREIFVAIGTERLADFEKQWREALGAEPDFQRFVDGREGASLSSVRIPGGTILERVQPIEPIFDRALELFDTFTKVVTGGFKSDTTVYVNDVQVSTLTASAKGGDQVAITNLSPFAWKGEVRGFTDKDGSGFSNGLFESLAALLRKEFEGSTVPIRFAGRSFGGDRYPTVLIG